MSSSTFRRYRNRFLVVFGLCILLTAAFNEGTYLLQKEEFDRPPTTVQLVIPAGTMEQIAAGGEAPSIPEEMVFMLGDVLEVKNQDSVSHQLGPIWVPPGATGQLVMERAEKFQYSCSFQSTRYLGFDVREPTTLSTRLTGLAIAAPTVTILVFIYSLLVFPLKTEPLITEPDGSLDRPAAG